MNSGWGIFYVIALRWMPLELTDDKSTLVQVMAWCRQATSHYLSQCWPRSLSPYDVTRPQWVKCGLWDVGHFTGEMILFYSLVHGDSTWHHGSHHCRVIVSSDHGLASSWFIVSDPVVRLIWTIWTSLSGVPRKAVESNHSLTVSVVFIQGQLY